MDKRPPAASVNERRGKRREPRTTCDLRCGFGPAHHLVGVGFLSPRFAQVRRPYWTAPRQSFETLLWPRPRRSCGLPSGIALRLSGMDIGNSSCAMAGHIPWWRIEATWFDQDQSGSFVWFASNGSRDDGVDAATLVKHVHHRGKGGSARGRTHPKDSLITGRPG